MAVVLDRLRLINQFEKDIIDFEEYSYRKFDASLDLAKEKFKCLEMDQQINLNIKFLSGSY